MIDLESARETVWQTSLTESILGISQGSMTKLPGSCRFEQSEAFLDLQIFRTLAVMTSLDFLSKVLSSTPGLWPECACFTGGHLFGNRYA